MKMYILVLENIPLGHALNSAAHASLACYLEFQARAEVQDWLKNSYKKVTCKVTVDEIEEAMRLEKDYVIMTESALGGCRTAIAFCPRNAFDPFFKTLKLYS